MGEYQLKTGELGEKIAGAYQRVEDSFVDHFLERTADGAETFRLKTGRVGEAVVRGYREIEDTFVGAYKKIEDAFIDVFLEKAEPRRGSTEDACQEVRAEKTDGNGTDGVQNVGSEDHP